MNPRNRTIGTLALALGGFVLMGLGLTRLAAPVPQHAVAARIRIEQYTMDAAGNLSVARFDPELVYAEISLIRSNLIGRIFKPGWEKEWGETFTPGKSPVAAEILPQLQRQVELKRLDGTAVIEIHVPNAPQLAAARIANAIAEACREYHLANRQKAIDDSIAASIQTWEEQWRNLGNEIAVAREALERLQHEAGISPDGKADPTVDPDKLAACDELRRRLAALKDRRAELEREFAKPHQNPELSNVSVEILQHAPLLPPPANTGRLVSGFLAFTGLVLAGAGIWLSRFLTAPTLVVKR
jgi:hypothetical protein